MNLLLAAVAFDDKHFKLQQQHQSNELEPSRPFNSTKQH
jgi:hypothetical protein